MTMSLKSGLPGDRNCSGHRRQRLYWTPSGDRSASPWLDRSHRCQYSGRARRFSYSLVADCRLVEAVSGCEAVVHLAARAHVLHETADDPLTQFMLVNAEATRVLALASRAAGVRRFVFVSSIAVHGPMQGGPLRETDIPRPQSDYGRSKLAAERHLQDIVDGSPMDLTILRPPLVYGPGVGARFLQLIKWSESGLPLPLGGINNARSLLSVQNLSDAIAHCIENSASAGETFLVADDDAISTSELIRAIARRLKSRTV